jgi:antitoxin component YwqK of YwqJK toxin-antitoxin module
MRNGAQSMPPEDYTLLRQATKNPRLANSYRAMLPGLLRFEKGWSKWHGKRIEFRKDGSKAKQTDYKNGFVTLRMEWDEAGNLTKKETFPVKKTPDLNEQDIKMNEVINLKPEYPEVDLTFNKELITYGQEYYPLIDLEYDKEGIASVVGEDEPFTGIAVVYRSNDPNSERVWEYAFLNGRKHGNSVQYSTGDFIQRIEEFNEGELIRSFYQSDQDLLEARYKNGKPAMKLTWGKDGNLIEKETF